MTDALSLQDPHCYYENDGVGPAANTLVEYELDRSVGDRQWRLFLNFRVLFVLFDLGFSRRVRVLEVLLPLVVQWCRQHR